jgi:hypothetical protein
MYSCKICLSDYKNCQAKTINELSIGRKNALKRFLIIDKKGQKSQKVIKTLLFNA